MFVVGQWRKSSHFFGVECGGKLVGERTRRHLKTTVQFAALVDSSREQIERAARTLDSSEWGLTLSLPKTKLMVAGVWNEDDLNLFSIRGESIEAVPEFRYLGSTWRGPEGCGGLPQKRPAHGTKQWRVRSI